MRPLLRASTLALALVLTVFAAATARAAETGTCTLHCGSQVVVIHHITESACCTRGNSCDPVTWAPDGGGGVLVC